MIVFCEILPKSEAFSHRVQTATHNGVNYAKFGDLLAESKAICGTTDEDWTTDNTDYTDN